MNVVEAKAALALGEGEFIPADPMNFILLLLLAPPKSSYHGTDLITHVLCQIEATHGKCS